MTCFLGGQPDSGNGGGGLTDVYLYGRITTAQMLALPTGALNAGDNCYNTDWEQEAWWDGLIWVCSQAVRVLNRDSGALSPKEAVIIDGFTDRAVETTTTVRSTEAVGVVLIGGAVDDWVTIAIDGIWTVVANNTIFKEDWLGTCATAGRVQGSGVAYDGAFMQAMSSGVSGNDITAIFKKAEGG